MRFFFSLLFGLVVVSSGVAVVVFSTAAEQGSPFANFSMPWVSQPAEASTSKPADEKEVTPPPVTVLKGKPIGDWTYSCEMNAQTSRKQCTIAQQLTDEASKSVVFAWLIVNDGAGNLVAVWQTPTGVLVNRGVVLDVGAEKPIAVPYTSCITGHCEAVASLAPDFVSTLTQAKNASATVVTVAGKGLTFPLSVNGLAEALDAVKASTAS
jgi:invasion protein IalB